jgi:hypothetical protein
LAVHFRPAAIAGDNQEWLSYRKQIEGGDVSPPSTLPDRFRLTDWLERKFQTELDVPIGSRSDDVVSGQDVRRAARSAETPG